MGGVGGNFFLNLPLRILYTFCAHCDALKAALFQCFSIWWTIQKAVSVTMRYCNVTCNVTVTLQGNIKTAARGFSGPLFCVLGLVGFRLNNPEYLGSFVIKTSVITRGKGCKIEFK